MSCLPCQAVPEGSLDPFPGPPSVSHAPSLCPLDDLVEKMPCSGNSSRVCECRTGMFCALPVTNTCARCIPHTVCPQGLIVKVQGKYPHPQPCTKTCAKLYPSPTSAPGLQMASDLPPSCWTDPVFFEML